MQIEDLKILFGQHPEIGLLQREIQKGRGTHVLLSGLYASARALALAQLRKPLLVIFDNAEAAQYFYSDALSLAARVFSFLIARNGAEWMRRHRFNERNA